MKDGTTHLAHKAEHAVDLSDGGHGAILAVNVCDAAAGDNATVTVVHHVEDIPACTTHALLLREGASVAQGPIATALNPATLSAAFGLPIELHRLGRRLAATVTTS